ncbi:MAG: formylglycine-generating enzyme family protein, partial [Lentisphaeria bacterium]|nr:formylglycine-generating enzyme family protein [Lentisphaeria bacterium]
PKKISITNYQTLIIPQKKMYFLGILSSWHKLMNMSPKLGQRWRKTHSFEAGEGDLPVTSIYKADAEAYAAQFGKSLPTSKQWEKAARGTDARRFPWGDHYESKRANLRSQGATDRGKLPVDSFPDGVSPYGCYNMSGNVWEWVSDEQGDLGKDANGKTIKRGIIRGGAHRYAEFQGHVSHKTYEDLKSACSDLGFRCAKEAKPKGILSIF